MIEEARKIAGSSEVWSLPVVATYEDFDSPSATQRYTETLYKAEHAGYYLMIMRDLFEVSQDGVGTQNGPRYTLRFCRAFDGAHLAKRSERGGWRIGIGPEVIAGEIDMLPTER